MTGDKEIVRMTTVYSDGTMCILIKEDDGRLRVEWRER